MKKIIKKIILVVAFCLILILRPDIFWRGVMFWIVFKGIGWLYHFLKPKAVGGLYRFMNRKKGPELSKIWPNNWFYSYHDKKP